MIFFSRFLTLVQLCSISLAVAQTNVTFAYIGDGRDADFDQYAATVVGVSNDQTTYNLGCPAATSTPCLAEGLPPFTLITGPSTYELVFSDDQIYSRTACQLTGSPKPTTGTCAVTWTNHIFTHSQSSQITYQVPNTKSPPLDGIYEATLVVVGSATAPASTSASTTGSGSSSPPTSTITSTASSSTSENATGTVKSGTTANMAERTMAPMVLVAGAIAGAAFGL